MPGAAADARPPPRLNQMHTVCPATCPAPGFPANYLGTINLQIGVITAVTLAGPSLQPKAEIFLPRDE